MENKDNVIIIDGVELELTSEQIEQLRKLRDKKEEVKSPFERVHYGGSYYFFDRSFVIYEDEDGNTDIDNDSYEAGNYCADEATIKQHALHMKLNNLLWRFSMTHYGDEIDWNNTNQRKYFIYQSCATGDFQIDFGTLFKWIDVVYFIDKKTAEAAIEEVIRPFIAANPNFDWKKM